MALQIDNPEADKLARELARYTGETIPQAVIVALRERLQREQQRAAGSLAERLVALGEECAALPRLDMRVAEDIIGYDEKGLPE